MRFKLMSAILPFLRNLGPIQTESFIDINAYVGTWHQVATSRSTRFLGTGIDYYNVSAKYTVDINNQINVYNYGRDGNGNETYISGY